MKQFALVLALVFTMSLFAGCGTQPTEVTTTPETTVPETTTPVAQAPAGSTADVVEMIYEACPVDLYLASDNLADGAISDPEMFTFNTALESQDGIVDATVSMPMMGSQAYELVLIRAESNEKAAEVAQTMFDNMDMRRWICVEASEKQAVVCGDLAMFVMLSPEYGVTTEELVNAFVSVCGGYVDTVIR